MSERGVAAAGTITIGGDLTVHRLGFGAMRITGPGIWGAPDDAKAARATLAHLPDLGIDFIDTADSYGPFVSEDLIRETLHPYSGMIIATKGGLTRHGPNIWAPCGRPEYLRQCVLMSLRRLNVDRIDLWQLHRIDARVPRDEQFGVIADMQREGLIRHVGLSEVSLAEIEAAGRHFPVVSVQSRYNFADRANEAVLDYCTRAGIAFIPWAPLGSGNLAKPGTALGDISARLKMSPGQVAIAWLLRRSPVMLPIPGTGNPAHLRENAAAGALALSDADYAALDAQRSRAAA